MGKLLGLLLSGLLLIGLAIGGGLLYAQHRASQITLPPLKLGKSSLVLASDNSTVIGRIAGAGGDRRILSETEVPVLVKQAHLAAEDRNFYEHGAISLKGVAWALAKNAKNGSLSAGGSTITQQFVKNAYLSQERSVERKTNEVIYAYRVEQDMRKDEILAGYVNSNYYGRGAYGVEDAGRVWFGVPATALKDLQSPLQVARAAWLAAIINQPSYYDDYDGQPSNLTHRKQLEERTQYVLDGLRSVKGVDELVSPEVVEKAKALLPSLKVRNSLRPSGKSASGDPHIASYVHDWLVAWQTQIAKEDGLGDSDAATQGRSMAESLLARGGMRFTTTINAELQGQLRVAAENNRPQGLANGDVVMDPRTGEVVAFYSAGPAPSDPFNYALYADRQIGSVMKTVVLSDVVRNGISVQSVLPAPAFIGIDGHRVYNDDKSAAPGCKLSLKDAIAYSNNPVHMELISGKMASCQNPSRLTDIEDDYPVNPSSVAKLAREMGADDSLVPGKKNPAKLPENNSLALGIGAMSPLKVATIGSTLANGGTHVGPHIVSQLTTMNGTVAFTHQATRERVLEQSDAAIVNKTLASVFEYGTAKSNQIPGHPMAGKTGTTNADAWGLMYSAVNDNNDPAYVCAAWSGHPDNSETPDNLWGFEVMRVCKGFFNRALAGKPQVDFADADLNSGRKIGLGEAGSEQHAQHQAPNSPAVAGEPKKQPSPSLPTLGLPTTSEPARETPVQENPPVSQQPAEEAPATPSGPTQQEPEGEPTKVPPSPTGTLPEAPVETATVDAPPTPEQSVISQEVAPPTA